MNFERWTKNYTPSLRGNLVRTFVEPIENHYDLKFDAELGKGGCGVVIVGVKKENNVQYAIKTVDKATSERGRLDRELKFLKDVDHTNVVRLFSVYDLPTHFYFVMEMCSGGHLGRLVSQQVCTIMHLLSTISIYICVHISISERRTSMKIGLGHFVDRLCQLSRTFIAEVSLIVTSSCKIY